jgi:PAS domain-containing protein
MLGSSPILGVWIWSAKTNRFHVDEEVTRLYGLPPACISDGASIEEMLVNIHPEDKQQVARSIDAALNRGKDCMAHYRVVGGDKTIFVHARGHVTKDADGQSASFSGASIQIFDENTSVAEQIRGLLRAALALAKAGKFWTVAYLLQVTLLEDSFKKKVDDGEPLKH